MPFSKYLGVYENRHVPSNATLPYRVALKRYVNSTPEYTDIGRFKLEESAAFVFNVYSITTFGKGAVINEVDLTEEMEQEIEDFANKTKGFRELVDKVIDIVNKHGTEITVHAPM